MTLAPRAAPAPHPRALQHDRVRLALALSALSASCCPARPLETAPATPLPAFEGLYADVEKRARASGAGAFEMKAHGFGAEGERIGAFVDVAAEACVLVAASASAGVTDVDAFAYADDGTIVAADERPSPQAAFMVCPPHPGRVYVSARVVTGAGALVIAASRVEVDQADAVSRAADARTAGVESGRLDSWPHLEERIGARRRLLGGRWEELRRVALQVDPRAPTRTTFELLPRRCADVFLAPGDEVGAIDLVAEDGGGRIIARGAPEAGSARVLVLCTETGETISLALRPRESPGLAALVIGQSSEGAEAALGRAISVDRATATQPLADARRSLGEQLTKAGFAEPKLVGTADVRVGSRAPFSLSLPKGCARVEAIAGAPLGAFTAAIWEADGGLLAETTGGPRAALWACGAAREAELDAEAEARPGPLAVEVRVLRDAPEALVAHPLAASRLLDAMYGDAIGAPIGWEGAKAISLEASARVRQPLSVAAHTCVDVAAAMGPGGSGLELRLSDGAGVADEALHADTITRGRFVVLDRVCAAAAGVERTLELRLTTGEGHALVLVKQVPD